LQRIAATCHMLIEVSKALTPDSGEMLHMGRCVLEGNPPIAVALKRSARARRLSLRISRLDGRVTLTIPSGVAERESVAFLREREGWLRGHLDQLGDMRRVQVGDLIPFEGRDLRLEVGSSRRIAVSEASLIVPGRAEDAAARALAFLKARARDHLAEASDRYAAAIGRSYSKLTLRDTRSRWGSCTAHGGLMYSWRLIMAPPEVLDYVAAHEVAHLQELHHGPAFWALVARICPDFERHRSWLRSEGDRLHRIRFSD
jgi:predicted metal-dependent hydrolase